MHRFALSLALTLLAAPALATDGVLEINQTCAENTGCFAGDTASFPVTLSTPGSYRLTSNLSNGDENLRTIEVTADNVTIDLNGFSVLGPVTCTGVGPGISCSPQGSGQGIYAAATFRTTVLNGTVRGAGNDGLHLGDNCRVENVTAQNNGRSGINGTNFCSVRNSSARGNVLIGIELGTGTEVKDSLSAENKTNGVQLGTDSKAIGVRARANNFGLVVDGGSLVRASVAEGNLNHGIRILGPGTRIESNVTTRNNVGIKINADGCTVIGNTSTDNNSDGIASGDIAITFYSHGVIDGNHIARNAQRGLLVTGTNNLIVRNTSQANAVAYFVAPGNQVGSVISGVDATGVSGSSGGNLDATIGPWANFAR